MRRGGVVFDGAMGSMLISRGLRSGRPPEEWNIEHPEIVSSVHTAYLEAGAEVIETNTFGGTPARLRSFGLAGAAAKINEAGTRIAREAVPTAPAGPAPDSPARETLRESTAPWKRFVAVSVGPSGMMLPPVGPATEGEIEAEFRAQIEGCGDFHDMIVIETMFDLREALVALRAARAATAVPIGVTLTYTKNPRGFFTIMGDELRLSVRKLTEAGADVIGANCTLASGDMIELARVLRESTELPTLCQPNAGKPRLRAGSPVYDQTAAEFAADASELFGLGINAVGGCCGTTPAFIRELRTKMNVE